ncbi:MAG: hypothetical protein LBH13_10685 [Cellulomonadaceae bacterium]|jgi:outer membrane cobalamin receptor|nr:hypothetical protein [Cellulomonadaceae bacterium]
MTTAVAVTGVFHVTSDGPADLEAHLDDVMNELLAIESEQADSAGMGIDLSQGIVEIELTAYAENFDDAVAYASSTIRTAIHAAGGYTHGWRLAKTAERSELVIQPASCELIDA